MSAPAMRFQKGRPPTIPEQDHVAGLQAWESTSKPPLGYRVPDEGLIRGNVQSKTKTIGILFPTPVSLELKGFAPPPNFLPYQLHICI